MASLLLFYLQPISKTSHLLEDMWGLLEIDHREYRYQCYCARSSKRPMKIRYKALENLCHFEKINYIPNTIRLSFEKEITCACCICLSLHVQCVVSIYCNTSIIDITSYSLLKSVLNQRRNGKFTNNYRFSGPLWYRVK